MTVARPPFQSAPVYTPARQTASSASRAGHAGHGSSAAKHSDMVVRRVGMRWSLRVWTFTSEPHRHQSMSPEMAALFQLRVEGAGAGAGAEAGAEAEAEAGAEAAASPLHER